MRKGVLRNFAKFTGKHLCQSLFFNKVANLRPTTLLKKDYGAGVYFPVNFEKFLLTRFLTKHPQETASLDMFSKFQKRSLSTFSTNQFTKLGNIIGKI